MVQKTPTLVGGVDGYESIFGHDFEIPSFSLYLFFNKNAPIVPLFAPRFSCYFLEKSKNSVQKNDFFSFFCTESAYLGCKITPLKCNLFARWFFYLYLNPFFLFYSIAFHIPFKSVSAHGYCYYLFLRNRRFLASA